MDGLEAILDRILADARDRSDYLIAQAEQAAAVTVAAAQANGADVLAQAQVLASAQAEAILGRARSSAAMEQRKALLKARQDMIDQAIEQAAGIVKNLPDPEKTVFCRHLLQVSAIRSGSVILTSSDRRLGPAIFGDPGVKGSFHLDDEEGLFSGGLIVRQGLVEENLTLDLLIKTLRTQLVSLAASIIFPTEHAPEDASADSGKESIR